MKLAALITPALRSGGMIYGGATAALFSVAVQAVGARVLPISEQAVLAIALSAGAFVGAVVGAVILEARLADARIPAEERTYVPKTIFFVALGAVAFAALVPSRESIVLCLVVVSPALLLGRTHAVISRSWRVEVNCGTILLLSSVVSIIAATELGTRAFSLLFAGVGAALVIRQYTAWPRRTVRTRLDHRLYIGFETLILAAQPLVLNGLVLHFMGAGQAVEFRLVLTVLGVLQPLLGFMRTRLLGDESARLALSLTVLSISALVVVVAADGLGVFKMIFASSWGISTGVVALAAGWKLLTIPANFPFARLRREGQTQSVLVVRVASSVLSILVCYVVIAIWPELAALFIALGFGEVVALLLFVLTDRRHAKRRLGVRVVQEGPR